MRKSILAALALFSLPLASNDIGLAASVGNVSDTNFAQEVLKSPQPVVVDFYADWCGPCKRMSPVVDSLAAEYAGRVKFVRVNVDNSPRSATRFGVSSIPTFGVFKNGRLVTSAAGQMPKQELNATIGRAIR